MTQKYVHIYRHPPQPSRSDALSMPTARGTRLTAELSQLLEGLVDRGVLLRFQLEEVQPYAIRVHVEAFYDELNPVQDQLEEALYEFEQREGVVVLLKFHWESPVLPPSQYVHPSPQVWAEVWNDVKRQVRIWKEEGRVRHAELTDNNGAIDGVIHLVPGLSYTDAEGLRDALQNLERDGVMIMAHVRRGRNERQAV